ncbi:hypothetical protein [Hydrogenophaga sp.]|uniref:hypothetical protein n=1 Tax=Hydrogenophaga sp. TaxID=1904254 RepID=UPI002722232E|nr:hypothetical protein [Hydrogenophaga sp.]MDO9131908.1 hypothetical protein [Hydrogenophaga sp.]MDP3628982.1 hypothetical protein [Hydrogenophaga sp.]MDZ4283873.1 hypothetical protein [Hydrogenophaga sp.]
MKEELQSLLVECLSEIQQGRQTRTARSTSLQTGENAMAPGSQTAEDLDQLAVTATRLAYRHRQKVTFNELLAIPLLFCEMDHVVVNDGPALRPRSTHWDMVQEALQNWAPEGVRTSVLHRLPWVTDLEHWEPETTRFLLEHALPGGATFKHELALPAHQPANTPASRLGFVLLVASSERGWPSRRLVRPQEDARLRSVLNFVLELEGTCVAKVGPVLPISEALTQGVCDWLTFEIEPSAHTTWNLHLDRCDVDRRWIHVGRAGEPASQFRVPLRCHLIGSTGLSRIVSHISLLAARHPEVRQ